MLQVNETNVDHGLSWMSSDVRGHKSMEVHGHPCFVKQHHGQNHGLTGHGHNPWSAITWSSPWTPQGCPWTLTMVSVHEHSSFVK